MLILTGSIDPQMAAEVKGLGAEEFLIKPLDLEELHRALLRVLGRPS